MPQISERHCTMKIMFKPFMKKLFGVKYERLSRTLLIDLILFWGLSISGFRTKIAPAVFSLTVSVFTGGVMWQDLSSRDNTDDLQNMLMLPFDRRKMVFSYITALGAYTFLTKTALLLAVLLAVSNWGFPGLLTGLLCGIYGILAAAALFSLNRYRYADGLRIAALTAAIVLSADHPWFLPVILAGCLSSFPVLLYADGYSFASCEKAGRHRRALAPVTGTGMHHRRHSMLRYLLRYLSARKNYLANTGFMWGIACVLPLFFRQMESLAVIPVGFAILSLNTPLCILLSCDPALEQAVRFLPGQERAFCLPYCAFIFLCNLAADSLFLTSWQLLAGGVPFLMFVTALFFALASAVCSVLLEWFLPVRNWKIESDLWHHPRKYIVPAVMLLAAGIIGAMLWG